MPTIETVIKNKGLLTASGFGELKDIGAFAGGYTMKNMGAVMPYLITPGPVGTGREIFVSPSGSGTAGTLAAPCSAATAFASGYAQPGDVIRLRGGTYNITSALTIMCSGTSEFPITIESYENELAVFDGSGGALGSQTLIGLWGDFVRIRNIETRNMPYHALRIYGNDNWIEKVYSHHNKLNGIMIAWTSISPPYGDHASRNTLFNCISEDNSDANLTGNGYADGGNADGITISNGTDNKIINCISRRNSDDGYDVWASTNTQISFCTADSNGINAGNGNGFKLGGISPSANTSIQRCVSWSNKRKGFDDNGNVNLTVRNCTSYSNVSSGFSANATTTCANNISADDYIITYNGTPLSEKNNSWQISTTRSSFISETPGNDGFLIPNYHDDSCSGFLSPFYLFSKVTTLGDPGGGRIRINNATMSAATELYIDNNDSGFRSISSYLAMFKTDGIIKIKSYSGAILIFKLSANAINGTGYYRMQGTVILALGIFRDDEYLSFEYQGAL